MLLRIGSSRAIAVAILVAALACTTTTGEEGSSGNLRGGNTVGTLAGHVFIGPICPVEQEGVPCPVPPATLALVEVVVLEEDRERARAGLVGQGDYAVTLPAGRYRVTLDHELGIQPGLAPVHVVTVVAGDTTRQDFEIDTGIR